MPGRRPLLRVAAAGAVLTAGALAGTVPGPAAASDPPSVPSVEVSGTLLQVRPEPGSALTQTSYAVQLAGGDIVPVAADFATTPEPNSRFRGRLTVPRRVQSVLRARGQQLSRSAVLEQRSVAARRVLALVEDRSLTMSVAEASLTAPAAPAATTPTSHRVFVAQPTNLGTTVSTSDLLSTAGTVASYWRTQSEGAAAVVTPTTVTRYATKVSGASTACGLDGKAFYAMLDEAADLFPTYGDVASDQLVIEVPPRCSDSGTLGLGTVGTGFASGGGLIATSDASVRAGTLAHEMGHNYGFLHANVDCTTDGCAGAYAGIFDVMGVGLSGVNQLTALGTPYRVANGITQTGEVVAAQQGTTATLAPRSATSGVRSMRVTDPVDGSTFYVDYRSGTGTDAGSAYARGATLGGWPYRYRTGVVIQRRYDEDGATGSEYRSSGGTVAFRAGESWTSPAGGVTLQVDAVTSTAASVSVVAAPAISAYPRVGRAASVAVGTWPTGTTFTYDWRLDGVTVSRASTWTPTRSAQGRSLQVLVTGTSTAATSTRPSAAVEVSPPLVRLPRLGG